MASNADTVMMDVTSSDVLRRLRANMQHHPEVVRDLPVGLPLAGQCAIRTLADTTACDPHRRFACGSPGEDPLSVSRRGVMTEPTKRAPSLTSSRSRHYGRWESSTETPLLRRLLLVPSGRARREFETPAVQTEQWCSAQIPAAAVLLRVVQGGCTATVRGGRRHASPSLST